MKHHYGLLLNEVNISLSVEIIGFKVNYEKNNNLMSCLVYQNVVYQKMVLRPKHRREPQGRGRVIWVYKSKFSSF